MDKCGSGMEQSLYFDPNNITFVLLEFKISLFFLIHVDVSLSAWINLASTSSLDLPDTDTVVSSAYM